MFHIHNYSQSSFQEWLESTHGLYNSRHLELGGFEHEDRSLDIVANASDQFLLYVDDEAGLCGSAAIMALPRDLEINFQIIPQGTWVLRHVVFHIHQRHPIHNQTERYDRIMTQFYQGLFEHVWQLASRSNHQLVLSLQNELITHDDLIFFGGFTFGTDLIEDDKDREVAIGVMSLTQATYNSFRRRREI